MPGGTGWCRSALDAGHAWRAACPRLGSSAAVEKTNAGQIGWPQRLIWVALAFVPSSLLLGVTTHITTDIASAPLFWVLPFALYLLTFIIAFARRGQQGPALDSGGAGSRHHRRCGDNHPDDGLWAGRLGGRRWSAYTSSLFTTALMCHCELAAAAARRLQPHDLLFLHVDRRRAGRHFQRPDRAGAVFH